MSLKIYLLLGAAAVSALLVWHYFELRAEAAKVPELERKIGDYETKMLDSARQIDALTTRLGEIDADREKAEAVNLATKSAIQQTAAAAVEELARAIPDNPQCTYPADAGRVLQHQLDGLRPGATD